MGDIEKLRKGVEKLFEEVKPEDYDNFLARRTPIQLKVFRDNVNAVLSDMENDARKSGSVPYNVQEKISRLRYLSTRSNYLIKGHEDRTLRSAGMQEAGKPSYSRQPDSQQRIYEERASYKAQAKTEKPSPPRQKTDDQIGGYEGRTSPPEVKKKTENVSVIPINPKEKEKSSNEWGDIISGVAGLIGIPIGCSIGGNYRIESLYGFSSDIVHKLFYEMYGSEISHPEAIRQMNAIAEVGTHLPYILLGSVAGYFAFRYGTAAAYRLLTDSPMRDRRKNIIST